MTPRDTILAQIAHQETHPVPYTLYFEGDVAERLDGHCGGPAWRDRIVQYMVSLGGFNTMSKAPIGEGLERDLFGSRWRTDLRPFHLEEPGLKQPSFEGYRFPAAAEFADPNLKANAARIRAEHPDKFSMIGMGWGLWENCWGIRGFENALMDSVAEPDFFEALLDRITDLFLAHVAACADVPADAIMFGDDWGDQRGVMIGPERWRRFLKPRYARIYAAAHAQGKLVISHCCGSIADILPDVIEIGLDVLESCQPEARGMNPYELKRQHGHNLTFWGCLGSQSTVPFGTPEGIGREVARLCREIGKGGGFILSPAKALQPGTPTENAAAVVEAFTEQG